MLSLVDILRKNNDGSRVIIFCETKRGVDDLVRDLRNDRVQGAAGIHGDRTQYERDRVIKDFKDGTNFILVATDVASRGLDVKDLKCVINYDLPAQAEDYVHRIGRTGRAGATGFSYSFFTRKNMAIAGDLIQLLKSANQSIPNELYDFKEMAEKAKAESKNIN